ncbi:MAG: BrnA antitoxin family protein [Desulfomonilaceae bacterium]
MKKEYDFSRGKRGAVVPVPSGKTNVTIPLDDDVLEWFRTQVHEMGGGDYQTLINTVLREHILRCREPLEETLRRVIREEMSTHA